MEVIGYPIFLACAVVLGACIGSFLNVVIYRVPLGMSVSKPKRSFCPGCKKEIPWFRNLPILTWLIQRGRCAECGGPIAFRYVFVEVLTAGLVGAGWWIFVTDRTPVAPIAALLVATLSVLLVSISFIDAEHMVVPVTFCYVGMVIAVAGSALDPSLVTLAGAMEGPAVVAGRTRVVVWNRRGLGRPRGGRDRGKFFLGEKRMQFEEAVDWYLREPETEEEELSFVLRERDEEEALGWSDLFYRKSDRLEIDGHGVLLDGERTKATRIVISRETVRLDDEEHSIEKMVSLSGKAEKVVIPTRSDGGGRSSASWDLIGAFCRMEGSALQSLRFSACMLSWRRSWAVSASAGSCPSGPFWPWVD